MPVHWDDVAHRTLFEAIMFLTDPKLSHEAIAKLLKQSAPAQFKDVTAKAVNHRIQDLRTKAKEKFKTSGVAGNGSAAHTTDGPATALTKNVKSTPKKGKQAVTGTSKKGKRKAEAVEDEDQLDDEPALKKAAIFKEEDEHDDY